MARPRENEETGRGKEMVGEFFSLRPRMFLRMALAEREFGRWISEKAEIQLSYELCCTGST
jgi:hypothetical protein